MNVEYLLTEQDIQAFNLHHTRHSDSARKRRRISRLVVSLLYLGIGIFIILDNRSKGFVILGGVAILFAFFWFTFYEKYYFWKINRNTRNMLQEGSNIGMLGVHEFIIGEDMVKVVNPTGSTEYRGDFLKKISEDDKYFYCYTSSIMAEVVPKRAFDSEEEQNAFRRHLDKFLLDMNPHS